MKDLLIKWSELEPEWCEVTPLGSYLVGKIAVDGDMVGYHVYPPFDEHVSLMRIQYVVQRAIAARGWPWTLWFDFDEHGAFVFTDNGKYEYEAEVSAAEALLAAYVKALEHPSGYVEAPQA